MFYILAKFVNLLQVIEITMMVHKDEHFRLANWLPVFNGLLILVVDDLLNRYYFQQFKSDFSVAKFNLFATISQYQILFHNLLNRIVLGVCRVKSFFRQPISNKYYIDGQLFDILRFFFNQFRRAVSGIRRIACVDWLFWTLILRICGFLLGIGP